MLFREPQYLNVIRYVVHGEPVAWARARGSGQNRFTAARQKAFKRSVSMAAWAAGARAPKCEPAGTPLRLSVLVYLPIPPSWKPEKRAAALCNVVRPTSKPDMDNWIKLPMDAMNGLVWADDAQVVEFGRMAKFYSSNPRLEICVERLI